MLTPPEQLALMFVVAYVVDRWIKPPRWRKWLGILLALAGLLSILFPTAWLPHSDVLIMWKTFVMVTGALLFSRRNLHVEQS
ncbi:hypothetical protein [Pseudomonas asplenii]|uniref:hypothetical protein n=1 Tax=Pseudomonas asplenii TaxID=53407 RepID=UPI0006B62063|nr:hypothetical protein [Pseudomonas fuscovaginae]KPA99223.1 hypothetical protein PF70_00605 [Pseudomonas fuscovaginae]